MPKKSVARELKVVFDTNALHTQVPSDLVNADTRELIQDNSKHSDLTIHWHMPEVVVLERHYQMLQKATELLGKFQKMDAILGIKISLTSEQLSPKIESVIAEQMADMHIERLTLDSTRVQWPTVIRDAAFRNAPFQTGDTEKGFRDAMILESFIHLVEAAPRSAAVCRLVLVTNDGHLTKAARVRLAGVTNAEVLASLEEVRNLINTLISTVDEGYAKELREKAAKLFFIKDDKDTLVYRERIIERINTEFSNAIQELPPGAEMSERGVQYVNAPRFIRKDRQRVHWLTILEFTRTAYRYEAPSALPPETSIVTGNVATNLYIDPNINFNPNSIFGIKPPPSPLRGLMDTGREKILVKKGHTDFNIEWSATVDRNKKLTRPTIDRISLVGTTWE